MKYVTYIMVFLIPFTCITPFQLHSITSTVLFTKNNKLWNRRFSIYMTASAYYVISKEAENRISRHN